MAPAPGFVWAGATGARSTPAAGRGRMAASPARWRVQPACAVRRRRGCRDGYGGAGAPWRLRLQPQLRARRQPPVPERAPALLPRPVFLRLRRCANASVRRRHGCHAGREGAALPPVFLPARAFLPAPVLRLLLRAQPLLRLCVWCVRRDAWVSPLRRCRRTVRRRLKPRCRPVGIGSGKIATQKLRGLLKIILDAATCSDFLCYGHKGLR